MMVPKMKKVGGVFVPSHLKTNYVREGTPNVGSGQKLMTVADLMPLMDDPKFKEAVEMMGRYEGHTKAVQVVARGNSKIADAHVAENEMGVRAYERKAAGALEDSKTLADAGVDTWQEAKALGLDNA